MSKSVTIRDDLVKAVEKHIKYKASRARPEELSFVDAVNSLLETALGRYQAQITYAEKKKKATKTKTKPKAKAKPKPRPKPKPKLAEEASEEASSPETA